ncbi:MAG: PepSY domain-containing protein [Eubacterium sp.]
MKKPYLIGFTFILTIMLLTGCGPKPAPKSTSDAATPSATSTAPSVITGDQAKAIALKQAGIAEKDTWALKVEPDTEKNHKVYDVSFHFNDKEYSYAIDIKTGDILKSDIEIDH